MIDTPDFNKGSADNPLHIFDPQRDKGPAEKMFEDLHNNAPELNLSDTENTPQNKLLAEIKETNNILRQILVKLDRITSCATSTTQTAQTED